ncbi:hypothetical protein U27_00900 [Candidatus Vecturithrix granuli]|uniref:Uncharacterized protein n=1 Tax=Vecturithrix granuli TaxID=1499967 RepID=A0A081C8U7_VECG1|nr:hypothetical protein U27_00900 [Candidatus Vecturithrix granuli]
MLMCKKNVIIAIDTMNNLEQYIFDTLGIWVSVQGVDPQKLKNLPIYLRETYLIQTTRLFERDILFLQPRDHQRLTVQQYCKHIHVIEKAFSSPAVLLLESIEAYNRKRLIQKQLAFIIPGKQMFIPQLLVDLKEFRSVVQKKKEKIQPAAQCLLLFYILKEEVEKMSLKKIAEKLHYTPMTISRAVNDLAEKKLCHLEGIKDKRVIFDEKKEHLWDKSLPYLQNPIIKKVYLEEVSGQTPMYKAACSALSYYTNLTEDSLPWYAISKTDYSYLKRQKQIKVIHNVEGGVGLEIWKYAPGILAQNHIVDPLSLYLTFQEIKDERVEMELERMVANLW